MPDIKRCVSCRTKFTDAYLGRDTWTACPICGCRLEMRPLERVEDQPVPDAPLFGTVEFFIEHNRAGIAAIVRRRLGKQYNPKTHGTNDELRLWVLNDAELYAWALKEGMTK